MVHEPAERSPGRIVIVEDEAELAELYSVWLGEQYIVDIAHDCESAYELFDERVDVVLLDRNLPDGSGDELLEEIRELELGWQVAMVTATEPDLDIVDLEFDEYLCKPIERTELLDTVDRLLAQANYGETISEYITLKKKKSLLEARCRPKTLAKSRAYGELQTCLETVREDLGAMKEHVPEISAHGAISGPQQGPNANTPVEPQLTKPSNNDPVETDAIQNTTDEYRP